MYRSIASIFIALAFLIVPVSAQRTEITITLNEQFFDTVIDALFQNGEPPEFSIGANLDRDPKFVPDSRRTSISTTYPNSFIANAAFGNCRESIRLNRENNGVRTAVRFRDGKIYAPLAFTGSYNPPLVGCVDFAGYAESNIDLIFDQQGQRLTANATVNNVVLNGTGGVGSTVIARMVQSSIDRKINPIQLFKLDDISFMLPMRSNGNVKMKAVGVRHELVNGGINVHVAYEFVKV